MSTINSPALRPRGADELASGSTFRLPRRVFVGSIVTPVSLTKLRYIRRGLLGVGSTGVIRFVEDLDQLEETEGPPAKAARLPHGEDRSSTPVNRISRPTKASDDGQEDGDLVLPPSVIDNGGWHEDKAAEEQQRDLIARTVARYGWQAAECEMVLLNEHSFLSPGFVDTHVHAPQVPNLGRGQQYELLDWLENITFPREKKFENPAYAKRTYESVIQRMLDCGTTCAAIYATLHEEATMILAQICNEKGMRAFVGKCQMDRNAPVDYREKSSAASMESTKRFIQFCRNLPPYGTPAKPDGQDPMSSSGSVEMDQSIARLSATMRNLLSRDGEGRDMTKSPTASPEALKAAPSSYGADSSSAHSEASTLATSVSSSNADVRNGGANVGRKHSIASRSSASHSTHGGRSHSSSRRSTSVAASGTGTPRRSEHVNALVQPILTPRFAIACSDALLASISALMSRDATLRIQTHLSENPNEIAFTKSLFPFCQTYTDVYDHFSLLTPRTILAHAIHLNPEEMTLIAHRKCGISHCPTSNLNLRSGASRLGELLNRGIKVGLGTDMSGGFGMSMLTAIRDASVVAKVVQFTKTEEACTDVESTTTTSEDTVEAATSTTPSGSNDKTTAKTADAATQGTAEDAEPKHDFCQGPMPLATLFYLATLGGADVCNVAHRVGSLDVGKEFDAILFNCDNSNPNLYIEDDDGLEERLEKVMFCGDDRNIASVFVRGRVVGGSAPIA